MNKQTRPRREGLLRSLAHPHAECADLADLGLHEWAAGLPEGDEDLVDVAAGRAVRWVEGQGWVEEPGMFLDTLSSLS